MEDQTMQPSALSNTTGRSSVAKSAPISRENMTSSLLRLRQKDFDDTRNRFIPRTALINFFYPERVERLLHTILGSSSKGLSNLHDVAKRICPSIGVEGCFCLSQYCTGGRMTLATLFLCGREDIVLEFFSASNSSFCDKKLPLSLETFETFDCGLDAEDKNHFIKLQWDVYTPFLAELDSGRKEDIKQFHTQISLPWVMKTVIKKQGAAKVSSVDRVEIEAINHDFARDHNSVFALKVFTPRLVDNLERDSFYREVKANLSAPRHDRIVRLLTAFTHGQERFYIVFPLANEGSLVDFWRSHQSDPGTNSYSAEWLLHECCGIAEALAVIHGLTQDRAEGTQGLIHTDIKPQNILCFRYADAEKPRVVLKIADFGEARPFESDDTSIEANRVAHVKTYRPPEKEFGNFITSKYDVWCLGCLFLEFITWLIRGQDGISLFSSLREHELDDPAVNNPKNWREDIFFKKVKKRSHIFSIRGFHIRRDSETMAETGRALKKRSICFESQTRIQSQVKSTVKSQFKILQEDTTDNVQLQALLSFIEDKMVVVSPEERSGSAEVHELLQNLVNT